GVGKAVRGGGRDGRCGEGWAAMDGEALARAGAEHREGGELGRRGGPQQRTVGDGHDPRRLWGRRLGAPGRRDQLPRSGDRRSRVRPPGLGGLACKSAARSSAPNSSAKASSKTCRSFIESSEIGYHPIAYGLYKIEASGGPIG